MGEHLCSDPQEGVIQYDLEYADAHHIDCPHFAELNGWRSYFYRLGLIGQDPRRYGGMGFGNVSHRTDNNAFVISGTQTGHLPLLCREHYVLVEDSDINRNYLRARGPLHPSSEALTHAALYQSSPDIHCVLHVHSPLLWQRAAALQLATTPPRVPYGTPAMARAVAEQVRAAGGQEGILAMLGHEDGVLCYAADVERAGTLLLETVVDAHRLDEHYYTHHA
ncbi:MAG: class II aldolase/adducin family protein [Pseudomonadota bacterium]|nr:class II aldolase/adducin family protein [Pseudomonadota bacterium]